MKKKENKTIAAVLQKAETAALAKKRRQENPVYTDVYGGRLATRLEQNEKEETAHD